jgi:hypothetical protein
MNNISSMRSFPQRLARGLVVAGVMGALAVGGLSTASAQSTSGSIFGKAPAGDSITVHSDTTGAGRTVKVDTTGRYRAPGLPTGTYTVTLKQDGTAIAKHIKVPVIVSRGSEVDFNCDEIKCGKSADAK